MRRALLIAALATTLAGCDAPWTNEQRIAESNACEAAGMTPTVVTMATKRGAWIRCEPRPAGSLPPQNNDQRIAEFNKCRAAKMNAIDRAGRIECIP